MPDSSNSIFDSTVIILSQEKVIEQTSSINIISSNSKQYEQQEKTAFSPPWEIGVVLFSVVLLAILKRVYAKKMSQYANAFISNRFIGQLTREERSSESMSVILLETMYFIIISVFVCSLYSYLNPTFILRGFNGFALFLLVLVALHLLKVIANNLIGWLLDINTIIRDFQFLNFLGHAATATALSPIVILVLFSHINTQFLLLSGVAIIVGLYFYRMVRLTVRFWWDKSLPPKYFILYICALEILPVLVLAKFAYKTL